MRRLVLVTFVLAATAAFATEEITVIGWNAESGDANPAVVAARIEEIDGCDIWGICEVQNSSWATAFEHGAEVDENADFLSILGTTGRSDKMLIIYDSDRFERLDDFELHRINLGGNVRAPLVGHFKIRGTDIEFLFMVNHLYRTKDFQRYEQARLLNLWASQQTLPIIARGDYNFDWSVPVGDKVHDQAYDEMVKDGHFTWIRPSTLKKTQASPNFNTVLDFVFLGGNSWTWKAESTILKRDANDADDDSFPDDNQLSDHRPVRARIRID